MEKHLDGGMFDKNALTHGVYIHLFARMIRQYECPWVLRITNVLQSRSFFHNRGLIFLEALIQVSFIRSVAKGPNRGTKALPNASFILCTVLELK